SRDTKRPLDGRLALTGSPSSAMAARRRSISMPERTRTWPAAATRAARGRRADTIANFACAGDRRNDGILAAARGDPCVRDERQGWTDGCALRARGVAST